MLKQNVQLVFNRSATIHSVGGRRTIFVEINSNCARVGKQNDAMVKRRKRTSPSAAKKAANDKKVPPKRLGVAGTSKKSKAATENTTTTTKEWNGRKITKVRTNLSPSLHALSNENNANGGATGFDWCTRVKSPSY